MRITAEAARIVSAYAGLLSNGYVRQVQTGADIDCGSRILDANSQVVWLGRPREAVAYYLGQVDAFANARDMNGFDCPAEVAAIRTEVLADITRGLRQWYETGKADAESRTAHYCPEIKGAGKP